MSHSHGNPLLTYSDILFRAAPRSLIEYVQLESIIFDLLIDNLENPNIEVLKLFPVSFQFLLGQFHRPLSSKKFFQNILWFQDFFIWVPHPYKLYVPASVL